MMNAAPLAADTSLAAISPAEYTDNMAPGNRTKRSKTGSAQATFSFRGLLSPDLDSRLAITNGSITGKRVRSLRTNLELPIGDVARVLGMSERNMMRREQGETALSVADADRAYRIARVADLAVELLGDTDRAKAWLKSPHPYLGGEAPVAMIETEIGTDLVIESLYAIAYGAVA
jgi:putative toxin-antitoxin system antitoxin component (TIGR02293 family)